MSKPNEELIKSIAVTAELTGTELSKDAARAMAEDLAAYPFDQVIAALKKCRKELTHKLTLAAIIQRIDDGRPGPEVAWAMFPRSEAETVVWTEEMAVAFGIANTLRDDQISARMAFKEAYTSAVSLARAEGKPIKWSVSFGHDPGGRESAIVDAVEKGRLTRGEGLRLLPMSERLQSLQTDPDGLALVSEAAKLLLV